MDELPACAGAGDSGGGGATLGEAGMLARNMPPDVLLGGGTPAPATPPCKGGVDVRCGGAMPLGLADVLKSKACKKESRACT